MRHLCLGLGTQCAHFLALAAPDPCQGLPGRAISRMVCYPGLQRAGHGPRLIELEQNIRLEQQLWPARRHAFHHINRRQTGPFHIAARGDLGGCLHSIAALQRQGSQRSLSVVGLELHLSIEPLRLHARRAIASSGGQQTLGHFTRQRPVPQIHGAQRRCIQLPNLISLTLRTKAA